jgi:hypothetical protein
MGNIGSHVDLTSGWPPASSEYRTGWSFPEHQLERWGFRNRNPSGRLPAHPHPTSGWPTTLALRAFGQLGDVYGGVAACSLKAGPDSRHELLEVALTPPDVLPQAEAGQSRVYACGSQDAIKGDSG